jgi:hypothetical protein
MTIINTQNEFDAHVLTRPLDGLMNLNFIDCIINPTAWISNQR